MDEHAVNHTLFRLSQPVEMEDVRRAMGSEKEEEEEPGGGSEECEAKRSCRYFFHPTLSSGSAVCENEEIC